MTERQLAYVLRIVGTVSATAVFPMVMPFSWMDRVHAWLGLGPLPDAPIVAYLARSTCAFYALMGGLAWLIASDLGRYASLASSYP